MSSFLATATPDSDTATQEPDVMIKNDTWFPDIGMRDFRESMRLDGTVTDPRLKIAIIDSILFVNDQLYAWKQKHELAGNNKLQDVPGKQINEESAYLALYKRAVYCWAKADLMERYSDYDTTNEGSKKAELLENPIDDYRRNAHWAIADIVGRNRTTIELI